MVILKREMIFNRNSLILYTSILCIYAFGMMAMFPTIVNNASSMDAMLDAFPDAMKAAFNLDKLPLNNPYGFFSTYLYMFIILLGGIFSATVAGTIFSKEEDKRTTEFLLTKPITREEVFFQKCLAYIVNIGVLNFLFTVTTLVSMAIFVEKSYDPKVIIQLCLAGVLFQLSTGGIAFLISTTVSSERNAMSASIGLVLVSYFLDMFAKISDKVKFLGYISPARYADAAEIIDKGRIPFINFIVLLLVSVVSTLVALKYFSRKDIVA